MSPRTESRRAQRAYEFARALIDAGETSGFHALKWRPFIARVDVEAELRVRGYELVEDGANHDPTLRRFFAAPRTVSGRMSRKEKP